MSDENSQQQTSTESTVAGAAKTGKAISNIAKGAAAGGAHGAAIEAGKSSAKVADSVDRGSFVASNSCSYASFYHLRIIIGRWDGHPEWNLER
ncbi:MAG: hypothetical protein ACLR4W_00385 [Oscillospiraceae bacterium]